MNSSYTSAKIIGDIYNTLVMAKISENKGLLKPLGITKIVFYL